MHAAQPRIFIPKGETRPRIGQQMNVADDNILTVTAKGTAPVITGNKKDVNLRTSKRFKVLCSCSD